MSPASGSEADRRLVTVVFADVSGFTALGERLDPEDVRTFQNDLFKLLAETIEQYGGFVEKFVGDAVMAVFGAPVAHEDDPDRALRTALTMLERMPTSQRPLGGVFRRPGQTPSRDQHRTRWWPDASAPAATRPTR